MVKSKTLSFFFMFFLFVSSLNVSFARADTGTLYEFIDDYENLDHVQANYNVVRNSSFNCMELNVTPGNIPAYENFSLYTQVDPGDRIVIADAGLRIDCMLIENSDNYIYYNYSVTPFTDFIHYVDIQATDKGAASAVGYTWGLANVTDDMRNQNDCYNVFFNWRQGDNLWRMALQEIAAGVPQQDQWDGMAEDTWYYLILNKTGTSLTCEVYTNAARTVLADTLALTVTDKKYNLLYGASSGNRGQADVVGLEVKNLWIGTLTGWEYVSSGHFYTTNVLSALTRNSIVLLSNYTADGGTVTVEFSSDNATWVNHNGIAGSDTLVDGFEAIDLRDLAYSTLYMRYNFTRGAATQLTPRLRQIRIIVAGPVPSGSVVNLWPYMALAIAFCLIVFTLQRK